MDSILIRLLKMALRLPGAFFRLLRGSQVYRVPISSTDELEEGLVRVEGTIERPAASMLTSPFVRENCILAAWRVKEWNEHRGSDVWRLEARGLQAVPFYLGDDNGEVLVEFERSVADTVPSSVGDGTADGVGGESTDDGMGGESTDDGMGGESTDEEVVTGGVSTDESVAGGWAADHPDGTPVFDTTDPNDVRYAIDSEEETVPIDISHGERPPAYITKFVRSHPSVTSQKGSATNFLDGTDAMKVMNVTDLGKAHGDRRYIERRLAVGDDLRVQGHYDPERDGITIPDDQPMVFANKEQDRLTSPTPNHSRDPPRGRRNDTSSSRRVPKDRL